MIIRMRMMRMMRMMMIMEEEKENFTYCTKSFITDHSKSLNCLCLIFISYVYYFDLQTCAILQKCLVLRSCELYNFLVNRCLCSRPKFEDTVVIFAN